MPITMHSEHRTSEEAGYEVSDMNPSIILYLLAAVTLVAAFAFIVIIVLMRYFDEARTGTSYGHTVPVTAGVGEFSQDPDVTYRIQRNPVRERDELYAPQKALVGSYGVITDAEGAARAHIPVEVAMELIAEGKAPYRQEPTIALLEDDAEETEEEETEE